MDPNKKLVVLERNADVLTKKIKLSGTALSSTIQMAVALQPLHKKNKILRWWHRTKALPVQVLKAVEQLMNERKGTKGNGFTNTRLI